MGANNSYLVSLVVMSALLGVIATAPALAHPADGYPPVPLSETYGKPGYGQPEGWNIGDIYFVSDYPDGNTLSDTEIYMLRGSQGSSYGVPLLSWEKMVCSIAKLYHLKTGQFPEQLTPDAIAAALGEDVNDVDAQLLEELKSPITGSYPYLTEQQFSPGNLYIKALDETEKSHIASQSEYFYDLWYNGICYDRLSGCWYDADVHGVYYVRLYGYTEVLHTSIFTNYTKY